MTTRIAARPAAPPALSGEPLRVAVLGATGYVGAELVRILERHPHVCIVGLAARHRDGVPVGGEGAPPGRPRPRSCSPEAGGARETPPWRPRSTGCRSCTARPWRGPDSSPRLVATRRRRCSPSPPRPAPA